MSDRPSDDALWASVSATLRDVVLPHLDDEWAVAQTVMLIALAEQARTRGEDPVERQRTELAAALDGLAANPLVQPGEPSAAAAAALAAAIGRDDEDADEVRRVLRPLLVAHLDELVASNASLMDAFRGKLPT
jgi:hypothetical protein